MKNLKYSSQKKNIGKWIRKPFQLESQNQNAMLFVEFTIFIYQNLKSMFILP